MEIPTVIFTGSILEENISAIRLRGTKMQEIYVREQDKMNAAIQRLERRMLAAERENELIRSRLANLELPPLEPVPEEKKKPGRKKNE